MDVDSMTAGLPQDDGRSSQRTRLAMAQRLRKNWGVPPEMCDIVTGSVLSDGRWWQKEQGEKVVVFY